MKSGGILWLAFTLRIITLPANEAIQNGDVTLGGDNATAGRVELYNNGQWGTICDDNWDIDDARVVCHQLGFRDAISAHGNAFFGAGSGPIHISKVNCLGYESSLIECCFSLSENCDHGDDAGVTCLPFDHGFVRLVSGNDTKGRVEIFINGQWGTICDDTWDILDATVVCRQLGFEGAIAAPPQAAFGEGIGPILLDTVECLGNELTILDCKYKQKSNCQHSEDAGVECINADFDEGSVRLAGGNQLAGRVEIYKDNQWGTVCDDDWDELDATVVCRQLGFRDAISAPREAEFGEGVGPIHLDSVQCKGGEVSLLDCEYKRDADCSHKEDASVTCRDVRSVPVGWIVIAILTIGIIAATSAGIYSGVLSRTYMTLVLYRIQNFGKGEKNNEDVSMSSQPSSITEKVSPNIQHVDVELAGYTREIMNVHINQESETDLVLYTNIPAELIPSPDHAREERYERMTECGKMEDNLNNSYEGC